MPFCINLFAKQCDKKGLHRATQSLIIIPAIGYFMNIFLPFTM